MRPRCPTQISLPPTVLLLIAALVTVAAPPSARAQEIFNSTQSANLPTSETVRAGNWLFEISHRFLPPVSDGSGALWGLDGPVRNRLGLGYAPTDRILIGVVRANYEDNLEINAKAAVFEGRAGGVRYKIGGMAGLAWNTDVVEVGGAEDNEVQYYGQLIVDALLGDHVAVGVVPTFLRNPRLLDIEKENAFVLGLHSQVYLSDSFSVLGEWIFSEPRTGLENDTGTFGIALDTRGHSFKIVVSNQTRMNATQFLAGTPNDFEADQLRLGFNITRVLVF